MISPPAAWLGLPSQPVCVQLGYSLIPPQALAPEPDDELDELLDDEELDELLDDEELDEPAPPVQSFASDQEPSLPGADVVHHLAL